MIDVEQLNLGDVVESDGTICNFPKGTKHKVVSATELGSYWISEDSVAIDGFSYVEENFTLVATNTKYSDIQEGDVVEVALVDEDKLRLWAEMGELIGKQGHVVYKGRMIDVDFNGVVWRFDAHELRVVSKKMEFKADLDTIGGLVEKVHSPEVSSNPLEKQVSGNHYKSCAIQPIEYIHTNGLDYLQGNVIKYTTRHKNKNGKADIEKAIHYLELIIELQYGDK